MLSETKVCLFFFKSSALKRIGWIRQLNNLTTNDEHTLLLKFGFIKLAGSFGNDIIIIFDRIVIFYTHVLVQYTTIHM